jgi:hypothetical protein
MSGGIRVDPAELQRPARRPRRNGLCRSGPERGVDVLKRKITQMLAVVTMAVVVLAAALSKIRGGIAGFGRELSELFGLPPRLAAAAAAAVVVGELGWAALLLVAPVVGAAFSIAALGLLSCVNAVSLRKGRRECLCFGPAVKTSPRIAVLRNSLLILLAVAVLIAGPVVLASPVIDISLGFVLSMALIRIEVLMKAVRVVVVGSPTEAAT